MTSTLHPSNLSFELTRNLSPQDRERLSVLLEQYLLGLEAGLPPSVEDLTRGASELAEPLSNCVSGLLALHAMAADLDSGALRATSNPLTQDDASDNENGSRILGDFELHEELGRGGMGVVYRATQRSLRRIVAIKLLPFAGAMSASQIKRFQNEAEFAASLNHPNIVPVYAFGVKDGIHYYAMQWIDGLSLEQWIGEYRTHDSGTLESDLCVDACDNDWQEVVRLGIQAAEGLHAAHNAGIIHRDVKPSNLLVDKSGKLWLTDFGLAQVPNDLSLTRSGDVIGTMRYMSPEQASGGSDSVDRRSDIFSLGVTLYEMLTLRVEFETDDRSSANSYIPTSFTAFERIKSLRKLRRDLPPDLGAVIAKATAMHPNDRYETARLLAEDLSRVLRCERTLARPPSAIDLLVEWTTDHRKPILLATVVGILIASGAMTMRGWLLDETQRYNEKLVALAADQPKLLEELATTNGKMGALQLKAYAPDSAVEALQKSEHLFAESAEKHPEDYDRLLQWSISENNLARALQLNGQVLEAAQLYTKSLGHLEKIEQESEVDVRRQMAATENNLGLLLAESMFYDKAIEHYKNAVELLRSLEPDGELMASVQLNLASSLTPTEPLRAIDHAEFSYRLFSKGLETEPRNIEISTQSANALNVLGSAQSQLERFDEAIATLLRSVQILESELASNPEHNLVRQHLAMSEIHLGLSYASAGDTQRAMAAYQRAEEQQRMVVRRSPKDAEAQSVMASVLNHIGNLEQSFRRSSAARSRFAESIEYQKRAVASGPNVQRYRDTLKKYEDQKDAW